MQPQASGLPTLSSIRFHCPNPNPLFFQHEAQDENQVIFFFCRVEQLLGLRCPLPSLRPQEVPSVGEALPVSAQQGQACFAGAGIAHTPFSVFGLSPFPTPPHDALGSLRD